MLSRRGRVRLCGRSTALFVFYFTFLMNALQYTVWSCGSKREFRGNGSTGRLNRTLCGADAIIVKVSVYLFRWKIETITAFEIYLGFAFETKKKKISSYRVRYEDEGLQTECLQNENNRTEGITSIDCKIVGKENLFGTFYKAVRWGYQICR